MIQPCAEKSGLRWERRNWREPGPPKTQVVAGRGLNPDAAAGEI